MYILTDSGYDLLMNERRPDNLATKGLYEWPLEDIEREESRRHYEMVKATENYERAHDAAKKARKRARKKDKR